MQRESVIKLKKPSHFEEVEEEWPLVGKKWEIPSLPLDSDGFVVGFSINQSKDILEFYDKFGFVVIKDVLDQNEINSTIDEIWDVLEDENVPNITISQQAEQCLLKAIELEKEGFPDKAVQYYSKAYKLHPQLEYDEDLVKIVIRKNKPKLNRNDPNTWGFDYWPQPHAVGFLGFEPASGKAAWNNRQNPNIYSAFAQIMGRKDLWVSVDRYGVMRPTRKVPTVALPYERYRTSVPILDNSEDKPGWQSISSWTHWDLNPWKWTLSKDDGLDYYFDDFISENNGSKNDGTKKLQGVLVLADSGKNDGGFCTVPGFHKHLEEWSRLTAHTSYARDSESNYSLVNVPSNDSLHDHLVPITARAGSLIIWSSELPHCNYPNDSNRFRMNQYIKMFTAQPEARGTTLRKQLILKLIPRDLTLTDVGKKVFGISKY